MTNNVWSLPIWSARNPLGIIALFISLIYGFCALLLGTSVQNLSPANQDRLVWFVIAFPVAVLLGFLWLVSKHHTKLYAPTDFRSDDSFLGVSPPAKLGKKLEKEVAILEADPTIDSNSVGPLAREADIYLLEGLAFQELQREFGGAIRREVAFPGGDAEVDGVIETTGERIIVEMKVTLGSDLKSLFRQSVQSLRRLNGMLRRRLGDPQHRMLLCIVSDHTQAEALSDWNSVRVGVQDVEVRVFNRTELLQRYGLGKD